MRRKQAVVWVVLVLLVLLIVGGIFLVAYQMLTRSSPGVAGVTATSTITPLGAGADVAEEVRRDHLLLGELSALDRRYRLFRVHLEPFSKEEIFSVPWSDTSSFPDVTVQGSYIGVFFGPGEGMLLGLDGKAVGMNEMPFLPPTAHFSVSPDGERMIYFKYLSSVGTASAAVRDMVANTDVFAWPIGADASRSCEFVGWSEDGRKAYCLARGASRTDVKSYDVRSFAHALVASAADARDAEYSIRHSLLVSAAGNRVSLYDAEAKARRDLVRMPEGTAVENVLLAPDASRVFFTAGGSVYSAEVENGTPALLVPDARLVSLSSDGKLMLFERGDAEGGMRFSVAYADGSRAKDLYVTTKDVVHTRYVGWFSN